MARIPTANPAAVPKALFYLKKPVPTRVGEMHLGRVPVTLDGDGNQTVMLSAAEAKFWQDQGAISTQVPKAKPEQAPAPSNSAEDDGPSEATTESDNEEVRNRQRRRR